MRDAIAELPARADAVAQTTVPAGETLTATYVDPALTQQLASPNNQILYGRRGAGKTHVLRVIEQDLMGRSSEVVIYANLGELGDTRDQPPQERAGAYLRQLLAIVQRELTQRSESFAFRSAQGELERFQRILDEQGFAVVEIHNRHSAEESAGQAASFGARLGPAGPGVSAGLASQAQAHSTESEATRRVPIEQVDFTAVAGALRDLTGVASLKRLTLLLDEWSEVKPLDTQPHLAEYIKRVFCTVAGVTVKIAAIQHRSRVGVRLADSTMRGFEESADIFALTMLDETAFAYDRSPAHVEEMFAELLYRHLTVTLAQAAMGGKWQSEPVEQPPSWRRRQLERLRLVRRAPAHDESIVARVAKELRRPDWGKTFFDATANEFMRSEFGVANPDELVADMFADGAFIELVRGAQGVPRDFTSMLKNTVFGTNAPQLTNQALRAKVRAFHAEKLERLNDAERRMLTRLTQQTVSRDTRCFLADRDLTRNEIFQAVVDQRLLHRLEPRVLDPQEPARTYDAYTLDYGSYVQLLTDGELPDDDFSDGLVGDLSETVAPFGDGRRMRRIIIRLADVAG